MDLKMMCVRERNRAGKWVAAACWLRVSKYWATTHGRMRSFRHYNIALPEFLHELGGSTVGPGAPIHTRRGDCFSSPRFFLRCNIVGDAADPFTLLSPSFSQLYFAHQQTYAP